MEPLFRDFQRAHLEGSGLLLSTTITPLPPGNDPYRLRNFFNSSSSFSIQQDIRAGLLSHAKTEIRFSKPEGNAWVDVYVAFWRATGEILVAEESIRPHWANVYESWKEVANSLIKGYSSAGFEAWTVPCLYVVGKYLRNFAIKADDSAKGFGENSVSTIIQDDMGVDPSKNEKLEDAARVINRIFTLCISDR